MKKFRLIAGQHIQDDLTAKPEEFKDPATGQTRKVYPAKTYHAGETVMSETDLVMRHGAEKFQYMGEVPQEARAALASHTPGDPTPENMQKSPAVFPQGQVSTGFQQSTSTEQGKTVSGPADQSADELRTQAATRQPPEFDADREDNAVKQPRQLPKDLDRMTVQELRKYAEDEEIDLPPGSRDKNEILRRIRASK